MSANPYELHEQVEDDTVESITTTILYYDDKLNKKIIYDNDKLNWNIHEGYEYLTLKEILEQIIKKENIKDIVPLITVIYESALWGVVFQSACDETFNEKWIVHGITKGYE